MTTDPFKITIHMVSSLDGFIARKDNDVSWFETTDVYDKGTDEADSGEILEKIDCYVLGARTYEHALELSQSHGWVYGNTPVIVVSHQDLPIEKTNISLFSGDLHELINQLKKFNYNNVWIAGGARLCRDFLLLNLADEIRLSILPVILGDGILFLDHIGLEQQLHLKDVTAYNTGMVELWYEIEKL